MPDFREYVRGHLPPLSVSPERENEIVAELALQIEQAYSEALAAGASEPEALRRSTAPFSDWPALAHNINAAERQPPPLEPARGGLLAGGLRDLRRAARFLLRNPAFAAIGIFTLAFGIGGNTAVFTMVDAVALRGLPYPHADQLMAIETHKVQQPEIEPWTSALDFFDLRDGARSFSSLAAISPVWSVVLTGRGEAEQLNALYVSADFFPMLGVKPALGRTFLPAEDNRAQPSGVVMLSHAFWQRRMGGASDVLGQSIALDGGSATVVGVLPADFRYAGEPLAGTAEDIDVWMPLASNQLAGSVRNVRFLKVIGRLRPGVSREQARQEIRSLGSALAERYPDTDRGFAGDIQPLRDQVTGRFRVAMLLLLGTVGFVLLMVCASVANLLLARASARGREMAVRAALGASRFRLLRQLLTEGLLLASIGGALGLVVAQLGLRFLIASGPENLVRAHEIRLDARALLFTTAAVFLCALVAGLPPAWRMARSSIETALREGGRSLTGGHHRLRSALVAAQVAVALTLMIGAGLLVRSLQRVLDVDPGFQARNLLTISTQVPLNSQTPEQRAAVYKLIRERLLAVPGVQQVGAVSRLPLAGRNLGTQVYAEGKFTPGEPGLDVEYRVATDSYFPTMGIPLHAGRWFDEHDDANPRSVILINETLARKLWPGESAVGKRIKLGTGPATPWITVVGVVGDLRHSGIDQQPLPELYRPYAVNPLFNPILVVRTGGDPAPLARALGAAVRSVDPTVPVYNVYLMQTLLDRSAQQRRFVMWLLTGFAMTALLLAGVGVYGTVAHAVVQRTQEIGLRVALGASPAAALLLVFRQGMGLTVAGIAAGWLAAAGLTHFMRKMLFEVGPLDPAAFALAAVTLAGCAALACYFPARRATRVDPLVALRHDS